MTPATSIPILTYHSISNAGGPTALPLSVFVSHLEAISASGWTVASLDTVADWRLGRIELPERTLALTFDDGFEDFADAACPELARRSFPATVFLPTDRLGIPESWKGANSPARPLMDWDRVKSLIDQNISFAPHGRTHADLATLSGRDLEEEIIGSRDDLERNIGVRSRTFAPPYGSTSAEARAIIARTYELSVGVRLGVAGRSCPTDDAPRIEMHYYRDPSRFEAFLAGRGHSYLRIRQGLREVRRHLTHARLRTAAR